MTIGKGYEWEGKGLPPLVEVEWQDCVTNAGWHTVKDARKMEATRCRTAGYLLQWNDEGVWLVGTVSLDRGGVDEVSEATVIPGGWGVQVKELHNA